PPEADDHAAIIGADLGHQGFDRLAHLEDVADLLDPLFRELRDGDERVDLREADERARGDGPDDLAADGLSGTVRFPQVLPRIGKAGLEAGCGPSGRPVS